MKTDPVGAFGCNSRFLKDKEDEIGPRNPDRSKGRKKRGKGYSSYREGGGKKEKTKILPFVVSKGSKKKTEEEGQGRT